MQAARSQSFQPYLLFLACVILFTFGLASQEITGFDSRFYLFAQEISEFGMSWFPTTYHQPYPDYPAASTFVIYLFSLLMGGLNKWVAVLPTAIMAAMTVTLTYLIGSLHNKHWGYCAAMLLLLTHAFLKSARGIALDMYPTAITAMCFYLIYSADQENNARRTFWIYPLLLLGFVFRGPIGLVMPAGVMCSYYLINQNFKQFFLKAGIAFLLLSVCTALLLLLAFHVGGDTFMQEVLRMEILGRMDNHYLPRYFYFTNSLLSYAFAYPLALLVMGGIFFVRDKKCLLLLFGWMMIILIGMSIPDDKKVRYILPMVPAAALIAAYAFAAPSSQRYFTLLRTLFRRILLVFPLLLLLLTLIIHAAHMLPIDIHFKLVLILFLLMQAANLVSLFYFQAFSQREKIFLSVAALSFSIATIMIIEPVQLYIDRARDFVLSIETPRMQARARLVFYRESPDGLPIKYLINRNNRDEPFFIQDEKALSDFSEPAYFVTSASYYRELPEKLLAKFHVIARDTLGHVRIVVFTRNERWVMKQHQICIHCYVSGKVQGVWFRASTEEQAKNLGMTGWARNLPDGRVEVLACGEREKMSELVEWLKQGPPLASVTDVSYEELPFQVMQDFKTL